MVGCFFSLWTQNYSQLNLRHNSRSPKHVFGVHFLQNFHPQQDPETFTQLTCKMLWTERLNQYIYETQNNPPPHHLRTINRTTNKTPNIFSNHIHSSDNSCTSQFPDSLEHRVVVSPVHISYTYTKYINVLYINPSIHSHFTISLSLSIVHNFALKRFAHVPQKEIKPSEMQPDEEGKKYRT